MFINSKIDSWGLDLRASEIERKRLSFNLIKKYNIHFKKAIDIGCASGDFTSKINQLSDETIGVDISRVAIEKAKRKFLNINFKKNELPLLDFKDNEFDFLACLETIYYLNKDEQKKSLEEIKRITNDKGYVLISIIFGEDYIDFDFFDKIVGDNFEVIEKVYMHNKMNYIIESKILQVMLKFNSFKLLVSFLKRLIKSKNLLRVNTFFTKIFFRDHDKNRMIYLLRNRKNI